MIPEKALRIRVKFYDYCQSPSWSLSTFLVLDVFPCPRLLTPTLTPTHSHSYSHFDVKLCVCVYLSHSQAASPGALPVQLPAPSLSPSFAPPGNPYAGPPSPVYSVELSRRLDKSEDPPGGEQESSILRPFISNTFSLVSYMLSPTFTPCC